MTSALAPDVELPELERRLLDAHLARCPECAAFAAGVEAVTAAIRSAALLPLTHPVHVSVWRRRSFGNVRNLAATAAVALMAFGLASRDSLSVRERGVVGRDAARPVFAVDTQQEIGEMRLARRHELIAAGRSSEPSIRRPGQQPA